VKEKDQDNSNIKMNILQISVAFQMPWWRFHHTSKSDLNEMENPNNQNHSMMMPFNWSATGRKLNHIQKKFQLKEIQNALDYVRTYA